MSKLNEPVVEQESSVGAQEATEEDDSKQESSTVFHKFISGILLAMFSVERYVCSCPTMRSG